MKAPVRQLGLLVAAGIAGGLLWLAWKPRAEEASRLSGYVEGETLYLSAPAPGAVTSLQVREGDRVAAGAALFTIDPRQVEAQSDQRRAGLAEAEAQVRSNEAAAAQAEANLRASRALAADARSVAERLARMRRDDAGVVAQQDLERAEAQARASAAQAAAAEAQVQLSRAQAAAARARAETGRSSLAESEVRRDQYAPRAPGAGRVETVFLQAGEWAPANQPVLALLPDDRVKLRFFAPERAVALYRPGTEVRFECDACGGTRKAVITWVSPRPEFTPPVIYSRQTRDRLVFRIEARPDSPATLNPGLPVDVIPLGPGPGR